MTEIVWYNITNAPIFNTALIDYKCEAKVESVYDGDSIRIMFPFNNTMYKWNCRLNGIDTPEIRTKCDTEKSYGILVRDELRKMINKKVINVVCHQLDKYGRLLITVFTKEGDLNINDWLIEKGYAFKYDGGKKKSWSDELKKAEKKFPELT